MTKSLQSKNVRSWIRRSLAVYWAVISIFAAITLAQYVQTQYAALAAEPVTDPMNLSDTTGAGTLTQLKFDEYFCGVVVGYGQGIIVTLAIVMMMAAGVTYIVSFGQTSGEIGGINTAKTMMVAAITGLMLSLMGSLLLGDCGFNLAGWIGKILPPT